MNGLRRARQQERRTCSPLIGLAFVPLLLAGSAQVFAGQTALAGPQIEFGVDGSVSSGHDHTGGSGRAWGPTVALNLSRDTALIGVVDAGARRHTSRGAWHDGRLFAAEIHNRVGGYGKLRFSLFGGGGVVQRRSFFPAVNEVTFNLPERGANRWGPAATLGLSLEQRLLGRLSVHQDLRFVVAARNPETRLQAGITAPLGQYPPTGSGRSRSFGAATIVTGQRVWITDRSGAETSGYVREIDGDRIEVTTVTGRAIVDSNDVQRVAVVDSVGNGLRMGLLIGLAAGAAGAIGAAAANCDCFLSPAHAAIAGGGVGVLMGGIVGPLVDSLHVSRQTVFERTTSARSLNVTPLIAAKAVGASAAIGW